MDSLPADPFLEEDSIVITASRLPGEEESASATLINTERVERFAEPLLPALLRLAPSVAVAESGPAGSLTEVRIRGAETNHTLLFIDGIRANDPASGNIPRFELLNADILSRIEVVRGPQSALWGSEAIGGVIAVSAAPVEGDMLGGQTEAGSYDFWRGSLGGALQSDDVALAAGIAHQQAEGIDAFGGGDRDGYRNTSARARLAWQASPLALVTLGGFVLTGRSQFDGLNNIFFQRADTLDESRNRLAAGRIGLELGDPDRDWSGTLSASLLGSRNRNLLGDDELNWTKGRRVSAEGQLNRRFATGRIEHRLAVALGGDWERFEADDKAFGGFTEQDRKASHSALTAEWRGEYGDRGSLSLAIRHDMFDRFKDSTNVRAGASVRLIGPLYLHAGYAEGIAQPTFFDLYGFFPGSFEGNPDLKPERSQGGEIGLSARAENWSASATIYRQTLKDEIVDVFDSLSFLSSTQNGEGKSRRTGFELEAGWRPSAAIHLTAHYAYLDADQPSASGTLRETRRPRHSGSVALDGVSGRLTYGAALSYTGERTDRDFDLFPAPLVKLSGYWLAGARIAYRVRGKLELFGRIANAFDSDYRDVVGYRTQGRSAYAGVRIAGGR